MDLSIIIVSWNVADLLKKCLDSIYKYTQGVSFEIFVIDNASSDNSVAMIQENFPKIKFIINQENKGFAAANNQGASQAQGRYILLLNPDTELKEDSLSKVARFMDKQPKCGIAGCHLENPDGAHQDSVRRFPSFWDQILILLKAHHIFPRLAIFRRYLYVDFDYSREQKVEQVMGAFFMIRHEMIEQIGLLDEKFFIWFEEVDFCLRAQKAGWLVYYTPITSAIHHFGQSFKQKRTLDKQKIWTASLSYYFKKHYSGWQYGLIKILNKIITIMCKLKSSKFKMQS